MLLSIFCVSVVVMPNSTTKELKKDNNSINNVCPGTFLSDRVRSLIQDNTGNDRKREDDVEKGAVENFLLVGYQTSKEVSAPTAFLTLKLVDWIIGVAVPIDGGVS